MEDRGWSADLLSLIFYLFILSAVMVALSSCAWVTSRYASLFESAPAERRETRELLQILASRNDQLRSLRSLATVYYSETDGRGSFQEVILVHRPDRLRLETISPLGVVLIVTADRNEIAGFHLRERLFYRGKSSLQNLFLYTQIPLGLGELTSVLMGVPPFAARGPWEGDGRSIVRDLGGGWKEAISFGPDQSQQSSPFWRILFKWKEAPSPDPVLWLPTKWQRLNAEGRVDLSAEFSDFLPTPAGPFPLKISLEAPIQQRRLEIRYQDPELNVDLAPALFVQKRPANARELPIESLGG